MKRAILLLIALSACESSTASDPASATASASASASAATTASAKPAAPTLTGTLFKIDGYTKLEGSCEGQGEDFSEQLSGHQHVYIYKMKTSLSPTGTLLGFGSCNEAAKCRQQAAAFAADEKAYPDTQLAYNFYNDQSAKGAEQWTGIFMMSGFGGKEAKCRGAIYATTEVTLMKDKLRMTVKGTKRDIPAAEGGACGTKAARTALEPEPCNYVVTLSAHAAGPLTDG